MVFVINSGEEEKNELIPDTGEEKEPEGEELPLSEEELDKVPQVIVLSPPSSGGDDDKPKVRAIGLIGNVDEDKASEVIYGMMIMKKTAQKKVLVDKEDPSKGTELACEPFELIISTFGGSAFEMLGIYDMMKQVREDCDIKTLGIGKVMSAGVLLLAAGTKGQRRIGANCRVMIHSVIGGSHGAIHDLENEMEEIKWMQERYIKILAQETKMTERYIKGLLKKKINVYLDAEKAVELGIADIIV